MTSGLISGPAQAHNHSINYDHPDSLAQHVRTAHAWLSILLAACMHLQLRQLFHYHLLQTFRIILCV